MKNYLKERQQSFGFAINGLRLLWNEANFRIHILALSFVVLMSWYLNITILEWLVVILSSSFVLVSEGINTVIEKTLDFVSIEQSKTIGKIKDISAAFVLLTAINAVIVAGIIFIPKITKLF